jgi:hypothetical protein
MNKLLQGAIMHEMLNLIFFLLIIVVAAAISVYMKLTGRGASTEGKCHCKCKDVGKLM